MFYKHLLYFSKTDLSYEKVHTFKETIISLYACGGLPSLLPINSPDIIEHIKGLSYLSDYRVIRASLGGAF